MSSPQLSLFSAEARPPRTADLAGLLCGPGPDRALRLRRHRAPVGRAARPGRAPAVVAVCAAVGIAAERAVTETGATAVRTAFRRDLVDARPGVDHGRGQDGARGNAARRGRVAACGCSPRVGGTAGASSCSSIRTPRRPTSRWSPPRPGPACHRPAAVAVRRSDHRCPPDPPARRAGGSAAGRGRAGRVDGVRLPAGCRRRVTLPSVRASIPRSVTEETHGVHGPNGQPCRTSR